MREERLSRVFDFDDLYLKKKDHFKIFPCNFISLNNQAIKSTVLMHKAALIVRVGFDVHSVSLYDKLYFTLFWVKIARLEIKCKNQVWKTAVLMNDNNLIHLEFFDNPIISIENFLENNLRCPTLLVLCTELLESRRKQLLIQ